MSKIPEPIVGLAEQVVAQLEGGLVEDAVACVAVTIMVAVERERKRIIGIVDEYQSGPTTQDYEGGYSAAKEDIRAAILIPPTPTQQG